MRRTLQNFAVRTSQSTSIVITCALIVLSCGVSETQSKSSALVTTVDLWPNPKAIPVCWLNSSESSESVMNSIRDHLAEEYGQKTIVNFVGWKPCIEQQMTKAVIRVYVRKDGNFGSGRSLVGAKPGIGVLPHGGTMELSMPRNWPSRGNLWLKKKVHYAALHEFGHALGLRHEHLREDATNCKHATGIPPENSRPVGEYDIYSVMNYCSKSRTFRLSEGDLQGIENLYGPKPS